MIARRAQMNKTQSANATTLEKSRLLQARKLAIGRNDLVELAQIDKQLATLASESQPTRIAPSRTDELAKLNERNRRANIEAARKAEMLEHERKRRERKLAASRTATPPVDRLTALKNGDVSRFVLLSVILSGLLMQQTNVDQLSCSGCSGSRQTWYARHANLTDREWHAAVSVSVCHETRGLRRQLRGRSPRCRRNRPGRFLVPGLIIQSF